MPLKLSKKGLLSDNRLVKAAVVIGAAVILLIFFSSLSGGAEKEMPIQAENTAELEQKLEQRLEGLIAEIDGVSAPRVMLTLDQTSQTVYARDEKSSSSSSGDESGSSSDSGSESSVVIVGSGGTKAALTESTILPRVRGVAVICGGAENIIIKEKVVNTVASVLDISTSRVYVTY